MAEEGPWCLCPAVTVQRDGPLRGWKTASGVGMFPLPRSDNLVSSLFNQPLGLALLLLLTLPLLRYSRSGISENKYILKVK